MNTFSDPRAIVTQLDITSGQQIADLGAGSGAYSLALAEKFKTRGAAIDIFAIEVQKKMVERLGREAEQKAITTIHPLWGDIEEEKGTRLRGGSIDWAFIMNTLFIVESRKNLLKEAHRILKSGSRLVVVDWAESFGGIGPKEDQVIKEPTAKLLVEEMGFVFEHSIEVGEHHYGFIARKL
jgi:ubiquinone/menaquinone biosynthesis C-methylase UbiE